MPTKCEIVLSTVKYENTVHIDVSLCNIKRCCILWRVAFCQIYTHKIEVRESKKSWRQKPSAYVVVNIFPEVQCKQLKWSEKRPADVIERSIVVIWIRTSVRITTIITGTCSRMGRENKKLLTTIVNHLDHKTDCIFTLQRTNSRKQLGSHPKSTICLEKRELHKMGSYRKSHCVLEETNTCQLKS